LVRPIVLKPWGFGQISNQLNLMSRRRSAFPSERFITKLLVGRAAHVRRSGWRQSSA
jgi:hypothetical protein